MRPPIAPMLARLAREVPPDHLYEPKWDGFRCLAFRSGDAVDLRSRHDRPLARYFPELVTAFRGIASRSFVLDGEIVVRAPGADIGAVMLRLHPAASRVERLARETPAHYIAFDLLEHDGADLRGAAFAERRARLERLIADHERVLLTPITDDPAVAAEWLARPRPGIDGVVAKHAALTYQPGKRAMVKVKRERTADCVLGGMRITLDGAAVASLVLGLYDDAGALRHVGVASAFTDRARRELFDRLSALVVPLAGHPWESGFGLGHSPIGRLRGSAGRWDPATMTQDWLPLRPVLVAEVAYDAVDGDRFRHPARFVRWRPDRDARSCTFTQLAEEAA